MWRFGVVSGLVEWRMYMQVVFRATGYDEEKLTLYIQAVHADQQRSWIKDVRRGRWALLFVHVGYEIL